MKRLRKDRSGSLVIPIAMWLAVACGEPTARGADTETMLNSLDVKRGICLIVGDVDHAFPLALARESELTIYVQLDDAGQVAALRAKADEAGLLGTRIYVEYGDAAHIHLADNLADAAIVGGGRIHEDVLRVLRPGGKAVVGDEVVEKPRPDGLDDWSHPYHGPDNNPQSRDCVAKAPYLTQFLSEPWYVPMPQVTVVAGGRVFKAFGHIALKEREWPWLNTLVALNGYNGTQLWKRALKPGFMIHRNTIIATNEILYLADDQSCKLLDSASGELTGEIVVPKDVDADGVWKWMALDGGVLYALVGPRELSDKVIRGNRTQAGWPWSDLGDAYGGEYAWGFGRTLLALNPKTKEVLWSYQSSAPIDSRAVCLADGRIFVYSHQKYLAAVDVRSGKELWKTTNAQLLETIGDHDRAQTPIKGFASTSYVKANDKGVYFAGPQRTQLVAVSAQDGSMMWYYPHGNFQLVLRDDGLYAMGRLQTSKKFDYLTGEILADLDCYRGNCTRATGTIDSIFTRGYRHTGTMRLDLSGNQARRIPLMRPACQDGVIAANGQLYWGPWMCDCNHSIVGVVSLAPAGDFDFAQQAVDAERLRTNPEARNAIIESVANDRDWATYRKGPSRQSATSVSIAPQVKQLWQFDPPAEVEPTAPVAAAGVVVWSGLDGIVRARDAATGELRWTAYTGGAVRFPPEIDNSRLYVGSGDGWVYCFSLSNGQELWRFRAAPAERKIAVHGRLLSNWPVGSGVLVHDGVVYAAAGITSYDGTHVYALDAVTGSIRWQNNTSGRLVDNEQVTGVSVQGHLLMHDGKLFLAGGNVVSPAIYDTTDGRCLNELENEWWSRPADARERFPSQPQTEMFKRSPRGRELFLVDERVRVFDQLLYSPPRYGPSRYFGGHFLQASSSDVIIRATNDRIVRLAAQTSDDGKPIGLWQSEQFADPQAMALGANAVLVAGLQAGEVDDSRFAMSALNLADGKSFWSLPLSASPVAWGLAVDREGRVIVALQSGRVICFGG